MSANTLLELMRKVFCSASRATMLLYAWLKSLLADRQRSVTGHGLGSYIG